METKYKIDIIQDFEYDGRTQALALSQETLLTSTPKVMQFACASSNNTIYLFESGIRDFPERKVSPVILFFAVNLIYLIIRVESLF